MVSERHRFRSEEVRLVEELCSEAALALEREHSSAALERALERERLVASIARQVRAELDLRSVMTVAAQETWTALGATRGIVRLADAEGLDTVVTVWEDGGGALDEVPSSPVAVLAADERRTVALADLAASDLAPAAGPLLATGVRAALATPVVVAGAVFAVLEAHRTNAGQWSREDIELAEAVAREIALAAQTARLLEENETEAAPADGPPGRRAGGDERAAAGGRAQPPRRRGRQPARGRRGRLLHPRRGAERAALRGRARAVRRRRRLGVPRAPRPRR